MIAVTTDSSADLQPQEQAHWGVTPVAINLEHLGQTLLDGSLSAADLLARVERSGQGAVSREPSAADYTRVFMKLLAQYDEVIHVGTSPGISRNIHSALMAADGLRGRVTVVDSGLTSYGMGVLAMRAAQLAQSGTSSAEIARDLMDRRDRMGLYFAVPKLDFLRLNGRLSGTAAFFGNLLKVMPLMGIEGGQVLNVGRSRGHNQAVQDLTARVAEYARSQPRRVHIIHTPGGEGMAYKLRASLNGVASQETGLHALGPAIAANTGPGAFGFVTEPVG